MVNCKHVKNLIQLWILASIMHCITVAYITADYIIRETVY